MSTHVRAGESGPGVYVHATVMGFHPRNRYRVVDEHTVAEKGWSSASGMWGLAEADRQVCPTPDERVCACVVVQRDKNNQGGQRA